MNKKALLQQALQDYLKEFFSEHSSELPELKLHKCILNYVEGSLLQQTLLHTSGNQSKASEILGINRHNLKKKIEELDIKTHAKDKKP